LPPRAAAPAAAASPEAPPPLRAQPHPGPPPRAPRRPLPQPAVRPAKSLPWSFALRLELQVLVVQLVPELIPLGGQIANVLGVRRHLDRHLLRHLQPVRLDARDLLRIVRQQAHSGDPEVGEDLVPDPPLPLVGGEAEGEVRVDRVESPLLELVGLELVE